MSSSHVPLPPGLPTTEEPLISALNAELFLLASHRLQLSLLPFTFSPVLEDSSRLPNVSIELKAIAHLASIDFQSSVAPVFWLPAHFRFADSSIAFPLQRIAACTCSRIGDTIHPADHQSRRSSPPSCALPLRRSRQSSPSRITFSRGRPRVNTSSGPTNVWPNPSSHVQFADRRERTAPHVADQRPASSSRPTAR